MTEYSIPLPSRSRKLVLPALRVILVLQFCALAFVLFLGPFVESLIIGNSVSWAINDMEKEAVLVWFIPVIMLSLGLSRMRAALKQIPDRLAAEQWTVGAAALALPSMSLYSFFSQYLPNLIPDSKFDVPELIIMVAVVESLLTTAATFYMPFILLTMWVKYKHRTDEF